MHFSLRATLAALFLVGSAAASHAHTTIYTAILSGLNQSPSNASPGVGIATVTLDMDLITLRVQVDFSGLQGTTTVAGIHAPTSTPLTGTAILATQSPTLLGFPSGVTSGTYDHTFDLTVADAYNPAFITASGGTVSDALNALDFAMDDGKAYFNITTTAFPGGEIRGFLVPAAAGPEPTTLILLGLGGAGALTRRRRL